MTDDPRDHLDDEEQDRETMKSPGDPEEHRDTLDAADGEEGRETFRPEDDDQSDRETFPSPEPGLDSQMDLETLPGQGFGPPDADEEADKQTLASPESSLVDSDFGAEVPSRLERTDVAAKRDEHTQTAGDRPETVADDVETMAGDIAGMTEARGEGTVAGSFAPTARRKSVEEYDENETMLDPDAVPTKEDPDRTMIEHDPDTTRRTASNMGRGAGASKTARAPFAGTETGAMPGQRAHVGPTVLKEGELLAGRYELTRRLGKGGMGEVWAAKHTLLHGMRAIKLIKASISRDASFRARFLTEGQTMMRIKHPAVVEVTDLDETRGNRELFMVMEHLKGRTLYDAVRNEESPLRNDPRTVVRVFKEMAVGMQRIHDEGIVHKDLKTDNVLLVTGEDGLEHPKVIDFGLAKSINKQDAPVSEESTSVDEGGDPDMRTTLSGTLAYMAPEQFLGIPSSFQSDIYALGVMLYESFNKGDYPVPRGGLTHYLKLHKDGFEPARLGDKAPDLDPEIARISDRCMAIRKEDRPASMQEVADELQWWLDAPIRAEKRKKRLQLYASAAGLVGLSLGIGLAMSGGGPSASLDAPKLVASDGSALNAFGGIFHLNEAALQDVRFTAKFSGDEGTPGLEIDGQDHPIDATIEDVGDDRVFSAPLDLSGLEDGRRTLLVAPRTDGESVSSVDVVIDRTPPVLADVRLGSSPDQTYTNAQTPTLVVRVDDEYVKSVGASGPAGDVNGTEKDGRWTLSGFVNKEGPAEVVVTATDRAGNTTSRTVPLIWKTRLKPPSVRDAVGAGRQQQLQIRTPSGSSMAVDVREAGTLVLTQGGNTVFERAVSDPGTVTIDLPDVGVNGSIETQLTFTDLAGNDDARTITVGHVVDTAKLQTAAGAYDLVAPRAGDFALKLTRSYDIGDGPGVTAQRIFDEHRKPVTDAAESLRATATRESLQQFGVKIPNTLASGIYQLRATGVDGAAVEPFTLTVDKASPVIESVVVKDARGRAIGAGQWATTEKVTVEATITDLTDLTVSLDIGPKGPPRGAGRTRTYTFEKTCREGENNWTLLATDAAGNPAERSVNIKADWTRPEFTVATETGGPYNDVRAIEFVGTCSNESEYDVLVSGDGLQKGPTQQRITGGDFRVSVLVRDGSHAIAFVVRDRAGHVSGTKSVTVDVEKGKLELPSEYPWRLANTGGTSKMRKLESGGVLVGRRMLPVDDMVFLDRSEVTNGQYRLFLKDAVASAKARGGKCEWAHPEQPKGHDHTPPKDTWTSKQWNRDDQPVVNVTWWDAYAFAKWSGRRLPTEAEWVKAAAQMKGELELRQWPAIAANVSWDQAAHLRPVTAEAYEDDKSLFPAGALTGKDLSPIGCLHMGGNVSEWVNLTHQPKGEPTTAVRGGNFFYNKAAANIRDATAKRYDRSFRAKTVGFRCAVDAGEIRQ